MDLLSKYLCGLQMLLQPSLLSPKGLKGDRTWSRLYVGIRIEECNHWSKEKWGGVSHEASKQGVNV